MKKLLVIALVALLVALAVRAWGWDRAFPHYERLATSSHELVLEEASTVSITQIRYDGDGWDDGLARKEGAVSNLLQRFRKAFNAPVATNAMVMDVSAIAEAGIARTGPLFLMTGSEGIKMAEAEVKQLRTVLLSGGTLLATAGSPQWHEAFIRFAARLFPGTKLRAIADDDPVMQVPYIFRSGAPALWHHGGYRTGGIRHKGRWVVIYHPGDLDDAWKTGHSGIHRGGADTAYSFGINVLSYAYQQYYQLRRKHFRSVTRYNIAGSPTRNQLPRKRDPIKIPSHLNPKAKVFKILEHARWEEIPDDPEIDLEKLDKETNPY